LIDINNINGIGDIMKLAKALKLKNRLAGEITRLKGIIQTRNVVESGHEKIYDVQYIVETGLPKVIKNLVSVKTGIALANAKEAHGSVEFYQTTPYWKIFMISEIRGLIDALRKMDTKNGKVSEYRGMGAEVISVEYVGLVKQQDVDRIVLAYEKDIDRMQDELDAYNATVDIEALEGISI